MSLLNAKGPRSRKRGFSLVEIVLAVGIFAITIVAVVGLLSPTLQRVAEATELATVNRMSEMVSSEVQRLGFGFLANTVDDGSTNWVPEVFFVSQQGDVIAVGVNFTDRIPTEPFDFKTTTHTFDPTEAYFAVDIRRHGADLNPGNDSQRAAIAYQMRIVWPAYLPNAQQAQTNAQQAQIYIDDRNRTGDFRRVNSVIFNAAVRR